MATVFGKQIGQGCYPMNRTCFMEFFLATFGHLGRVRFTVQNYCGREKCQAPPWAFGWRAWRKPSTNFLVPPKLGYSVRTLRPHTCLILPCVRSDNLHVKRYSRPRSSKELHKREKYQIYQFLNTGNYAEKKNDYRARSESGHRPLSQLPQERKRQGHETAVLRQGLPVGTLLYVAWNYEEQKDSHNWI